MAAIHLPENNSPAIRFLNRLSWASRKIGLPVGSADENLSEQQVAVYGSRERCAFSIGTISGA
jgi:hypothetical protein